MSEATLSVLGPKGNVPMNEKVTTETADCINCYREELLIYLVQRFGSLSFAQRVFAETKLRLDDSEFLNYVPNPHIYLIGYALSLGLEFMQVEQEERKQSVQAKEPRNTAFVNVYTFHQPSVDKHIQDHARKMYL
jgi:hypothetical protein